MASVQATYPHECVAFEQGLMDSHAAYHKGRYTFVMDGEYIVKNARGIRKMRVKAGDSIPTPEWVIGEWCGVFYSGALKRLE